MYILASSVPQGSTYKNSEEFPMSPMHPKHSKFVHGGQLKIKNPY
jgi:hypothetical protein